MRRLLAYLAFSIAAVASCAALAGPASEYQVKAVFLFNFSQFVSWPAAAFSSAGAPLVIGVLGDDPFGGELDAVVAGEHVGGRALIVRRYHDVAEVKDCQILFIDRSEAPRLRAIVEALRGRSILTVSDIDGAASGGVMIDLVLEGGHVHMRINVAAARASGLALSAQLLRPAEIVGPAGG
jgi:YfiR/HmsC-like